MAAVEHAVMATDSRMDRERNKDSPAVKFTAVNGNSNHPSPRTTSFRPERPSPPDNYHQHSLPRQNGPFDQPFARQQILNIDKRDQQQPTQTSLRHASPPQQIQNSGKRKRSVESLSSSSEQARPDSAPRNGMVPATTNAEADPLHNAQNPVYRTHDSIHQRDQWRPQHPSTSSMSEEQMADSLRNGMRNPENRFDENDGQPELRIDTRQPSEYSQEMGDDSANRTTKNARKRNFAQRTKTGCQERKKKCDEHKPACLNCLRGSFHCKGYGPKDPGVKSSPARAVPLQSKPAPTTQGPVGYYPVPTTARHVSQHWGDDVPDNDPSFAYESEAARSQRGYRHPYPPSSDHDGAYMSAVSPHSTYSHATFQDRRPQPPPFRAPTISSNGSSGPSQSAVTAQLALQHPPPTALSSSQLSRMSEKEKMLVGQPYRHYVDDQLIKERNDCRTALERFNNAARPSTGTSIDERGRLFRGIVVPDHQQRMRHPRDPVGRVGHRVIVEAPFTCEYGYNINIGDNVLISAGCYIQDCCKISIGSNTVIGPNVKFYGLTVPMDPKSRNGTQGLFYAGTIVIEEDCFIGGDVIILPHRTIRKGSVVGAGTIVSKDVQANTVVANNSMRLIRGIGPNAEDSHKNSIQTENDISIRLQAIERNPGYDGR